MTEKEILQIFKWTIDNYEMIKTENVKEKFGYFMAIMDIFGELISYQTEQKD